MTFDELEAIIQRHQGRLSEPVVVDPVIDNPNKKKPSDPDKIPNPSPTYRYNLKDGKFFTAKDIGPPGTTGVDFQIIDPGTAVQPLTPADRLPSAATDLVKLDARGNVIPAGDTTTPAAKLRDPSTGAVTDLPDTKTNPEGTLKEFGDRLLNIKPDGTFTVVTTKDPAAGTAQAKSLKDAPDGSLWEYDPNQPAGQRLTKVFNAPVDKTAPKTEVRNGVTYQYDPSTRRWIEASGLPPELPEKKPVAVSTNTTARKLVPIDDQGQIVGEPQDNPNYVEPVPQQLTADLVAAKVPLLKGDGTIVWVPNENRVPAGQAMEELLGQVGARVNGQQMSMADAKDLLTSTVSVLNAQTSQTNAATAQQQAQTAEATNIRGAAGDIIQAGTQAAQTGAGLLNQRVQAGQGMLSSILGLAGQRPMVGLPANAGQMIMGDIQGLTAQLGGGQEVYDTAARMVQAADPAGGRSQEAQLAYGVLAQMLDKYKQQSGEDHPTVVATRAANASQQANGFVPPATVQQAAPMMAPQPVMTNYGGLGPWANGQTPPPGTTAYQPGYNPATGGFVAPPMGVPNLVVPPQQTVMTR